MDEAAMTADLDERGLLDAAQRAGCYALRLDVPDDLSERWDAEFDVRPDGLVERFGAADRALYCGASEHVYDRLCDHAAGDVRQAAILRVCPPEAVVDIAPTDTPFADEYSFALNWSAAQIAVWCDGEVF